MNPDLKLRIGGLIAAVAVAIATWWIIGLVDSSSGPDYLLRPPSIRHEAEVAAGVTALVIVGVVGIWAVVQNRRRPIRAGWWMVACLLMLAGFITGCGYRVITSGGHGANIGGGMAIFFGGPLVLISLIGATMRSRSLLLRDPQCTTPDPSPKKPSYLSTAALVTSIVGLFGGAIPFLPVVAATTAGTLGWIALRRIRHDPTVPGRGTAMAALAIAALILVIFVVGVIWD